MLSAYSDEGRQMALAYILECWVRHLVHASIPTPGQWFDSKGLSHFDIDSSDLDTSIEVKGSSNMDQLKLFSDQLDSWVSDIGFPFERGFVWIFSYRNYTQKGGYEKRRRLLGKVRSVESLRQFLAEHINTAYVVDVQVLAAWRERHGLRPYNRDPMNPRSTVKINRSDLRDLAKNTRSGLSDLGLEREVSRWIPHNAMSIRSRKICAEVDGYSLDFELIPLIPQHARIQLFKQLNGSVQKM